MNSLDFIHHVRRLRARLNYQRNLLADMEGGVEFPRRRLLHDSEQMLNHLSVVEATSIADVSGSSRLHSLSSEFYRRYDHLIGCMERTLGLATQLALMRQGRMSEARITQADVVARASCRICGERFGEGMVAGVLRCSHRFHRRCIVGRFAVQTRCPTCGLHI